MKIIDLLNKIANGEEVPKKIRIEHWCYNFEWKDYASNYVDDDEKIDLMSALSCDREELNYRIKIIEEDKKIKRIEERASGWWPNSADGNVMTLKQAVNELIDEVNKLKGDNDDR